jgi:RND superfamily putative drug exporter
MSLLGERNWWAPTPLRRFHERFGLHEAPSTPPPATELVAEIGAMPSQIPANTEPEGERIGAGNR